MGWNPWIRATTATEPSPTRRIVLRAAYTAGVVAGTAGALAPILAADADTAAATDPGSGPRQGPELAPERFAEMYRGREIRGTATGTRAVAAVAAAAEPGADVRIDGRPLHIMRRADGSYLSAVNHYESFPTLVATARAAVDELGAAQLPPASAHHV